MKLILILMLLCGTFTLNYSHSEERSSTIYGRITSPLGEGIEGAEITLRKLSLSDGALGNRYQVKCDKDGKYKLTELPEGHYLFAVRAPGFRENNSNIVRLSSGEETLVDIGLEVGLLTDVPAWEVTGRVILADKTPVSDASLVLMSATTRQVITQARTNRDGTFRINRMSGDFQFILFAYHAGMKVNATALTPEAGKSNFVELTLSPLRDK